MYENELKKLEMISQAVGACPDMVQGGGGNTSVKISERLMAVKASGYKLSQVTATDGYVVVDYKNIKEYYENVDLNSGIDYEKDSVEFVKKSIVEMEGLKSLRPSVEAGFHSVLKKCVIHSHSVYSNIVCCAKNGRQIMQDIFKDSKCTSLWIPYINPGFSLTLKIQEEISKCIAGGGKFPEVIFMENHGLIVNADDHVECIELHEYVNNAIKAHLSIKDAYPAIKISRVDETAFASRTSYLTEYFKGRDIDSDFFDRIVLYPDQLVYLNGSIAVNKGENKLIIDTDNGILAYKTSYSEALTIEETLLAYIYVINQIKACGLELKTMSDEEVNFIKNWESEKYRKSVVKDLNK